MASLALQSWRLPLCVQVPPRCRWKTFLSARDTSIHGAGQRLLELLPSLSASCRRCLHLTATSLCSSSHHSVTVDVGESPLTFSTGKYVKLADGAILVQSGETSVMVTAVSDKNSSASGVGTPLIVDYRERYSASNKIPLTFFRRELRATSSEIIVSRFIDRSIRPLFPPGYNCNTQVICNMLALDRHHDPEILSINGASAALAVSDIPWNGPIGAVRIGLIDDQFHINPSRKMLSSSKLNLIVASTADRIMMVEGSAHEVTDEQFCEAVNLGFKEAQPLIASLSELQQMVNSQPREAPLNLPPQEIVDLAKDVCEDSVKSILLDSSHKKLSRDTLLFASLDELKKQVGESHPSVSEKLIGDAFWNHVTKEAMCSVVLDHQSRCDGRGMRDLRPISCEVDVFKPLHGCSIFTRGETQVLCSVTFDSPRSAYRPNLLSLILGGPKNQSFMVHYEFPPFATNTTGMFLGMGRREIGHGCLAEKAMAALMPSNYPFTIRVNSQVLESNGSSSMATVCAGSLALFDAGVPMPHAVAGVACGLFSRTKPDSEDIDQYQILTDINGIEDSVGNMDFKMAGTRNGITAVQVDFKGLPGIPFHIFEEAVMQSRDARYSVLDKMDETMSAPREGIKEHGPAYNIITVPSEKRGRLFGAGGYRIKAIAEETDIVVERIDEEKISVFAPSQEAMEEAMEKIDAILNEIDTKPVDIPIGSVIEVLIKDVRDYGFMAELAPGVLVLLHNKQLGHDFISHPLDSGIKVGDKVSVKFLGQDTNGRYLISRRALLPPPADRQQPNSNRPRQPRSTSHTPHTAPKFEIGSELEVTIIDELNSGFLVELAPGVTSLLHNSRINHSYVKHPSVTGFKIGDKLKVQFQGYNAQGRTLVSRTALLPPPPPPLSSSPHPPPSPPVSRTSPPSPWSPANQVSNKRWNNDGQKSTPARRKYEAELKRLGVKDFDVIEVTIKAVVDYGFIVEVKPGVIKLLHLSQLTYDYITHPSESGLKIGDKVHVRVIGPDRSGGLALSRKVFTRPSRSAGSVDDDAYKVAAASKKTLKHTRSQLGSSVSDQTLESATSEGYESQPVGDGRPVSESISDPTTAERSTSPSVGSDSSASDGTSAEGSSSDSAGDGSGGKATITSAEQSST